MSYVDPFAFETKDNEVEIFFNGSPVGLHISLRSPFSDEVKAVEKSIQRRQVAELKKNRGQLNIDIDRVKLVEREKLISHVSGWRWDKEALGIGGAKPEYSEKSINAFLDHPVFGPSLTAQLNEELANEANFLQASRKA